MVGGGALSSIYLLNRISTPPEQITQKVQDELSAEIVSDPLAYAPIEERIASLQMDGNSSSGLLLADLHLQRNDFPQALIALERLEKKNDRLADFVLLKRAQVLTKQGDRTNANLTWNRILTEFPNSAPAAHALSALQRDEELIQKFPSHPLARQAYLRLINRNPRRWELIANLAYYFPDTPNLLPLLNQLTNSNYSLTGDQWWAIADAYYDNFEFTRAANAYARATANSFTAYRMGRSWQRARQTQSALNAYNNLVQKYPQSPEAPRALIRIMQIGTNREMMSASELILKNYPDTAPEALLLRSELGDANASEVAKRTLLQNYSQSNSAGELRWRIARNQARSGNLASAINTVNSIITENPQSSILAEAAFWGGKWSIKRGDRATANRLFTSALKLQPDSYFAWRSAVMLGWQEVGDFTTARNVNLALRPQSGRSALPSGSSVVTELYLSGLDREAWEQWQMELKGKRLLNPKEIFTDAILRVGVNDNLRGIRAMESLTWIDVSPAQQEEIRSLMKLPQFQQTIYPFPYFNQIEKWSREFSLPPALVIALIRQESRFESAILSRSGAVGLMQVMPDTGAWIAEKRGIRNYSLKNPDDNLNFGTWYLDFTHRSFNNNSMLAIASYNAGPGAIGRWVERRGLGDMDEFINAIPYAETRDYVPKVFGNYWNYLRLYSPVIQQKLKSLS
jgi:soluble lytic murein transglycosylase